MDRLKWGFLGTGYIANNFADCMSLVPDSEKKAVTGTSMTKADAFADKHGFEKRFDDFDDMLANAELDIVYIAVPNNLHLEYVMKAFDAGVHVLCEKPMADNEGQLSQMIEKAKEKDLFLMEALWTRCFPATQKTRQWIEEGRIGQLRSVRADFGLKAAPGWQAWKADVAYSGGAMRDVGIYPLAMVSLGFNRQSPVEIASNFFLKNGADYHSEILLKYEDNRAAIITASFNMATNYTAAFYGDKGMIVLGPRFFNPRHAELFSYDSADEFNRLSAEVFEDDYQSHGMQYEIAHVNECIRRGEKESSLYPLSESTEIIKIIDHLRKEWGVRFKSDTW